MRNTSNNTQTLCVKLSSAQFLKLTETTNDLLDKFRSDKLEPSIFHLITGWIGDDNLENIPSKERQDIFNFFVEFLAHFKFCESIYLKRENLAYPEETFNFLLDLDLKKTKKYFKETKRAFLSSFLADSNEIRNDTKHYVETIQKYVKVVQLIKTQNH